MRQSGSLPPGSIIWWRWHITDEKGRETVTEKQTIIWIDNVHDWQKLTQGKITLHWYDGSESFAKDLLGAATDGLALLKKDTGMAPEENIDLYIFSNTEDMKDAILYEPSWTGGVAYSEHNIVIIGISPDNVDWGKDTEIHELTHVLVGRLTFSCLGDVPTWLNEGLAVYSEGGLDPTSQDRLDAAIQDNTLFSVRSLSGGFSEIADKADLSYSQSYSIVKFLVETYGRDKMTGLLKTLRDGSTIDAALQSVYGFDVDGLEDAWRTAIGAQPRVAGPEPTPTDLPTPVPTFVPVGAAPAAPAATATSAPDEAAGTAEATVTPRPNQPAVTDTSQPAGQKQTGVSNILLLLAVVGLLCLVVVGIVVLGILSRRRSRSRRKIVQEENTNE
jgi:hypothetical protein